MIFTDPQGSEIKGYIIVDHKPLTRSYWLFKLEKS